MKKNPAGAGFLPAANPRSSRTTRGRARRDPDPRQPPIPASTSRCASIRFHFGEQFLDRQFLQILRVEPFQLRPVKYSVRAANACERKLLDQVLCSNELLVAARRPSEQREKIPKRFRQESFRAVHVDVGRAVPFRQTRFVRTEN